MITIEETLTHSHTIECALSSAYSRVQSLTIRNQSQNMKNIEGLAEEHGIRVRYEKSHPSRPQIEARVLWYLFSDWKEFRSKEAQKDAELILFLDRLNDPQNVGNILRTASFFGAAAVVIPKSRSVKLGETVIRTSTGGALSIPVIHPSNLVRTMQEFQEEGAYIWGLSAHAQNVLSSEQPVNKKIGLVVGSEGEGMASLTEKTCDMLLKLSAQGFHESLNAASAAAIGIYECMKKIQA
ncbi:MAG: RNA methyltransferase [Bdellovibrionales bacterium]|nr:RNA methyltransferase [Bdellovibrionales bacterium]